MTDTVEYQEIYVSCDESDPDRVMVYDGKFYKFLLRYVPSDADGSDE
jgi:DNA topoisomerase IB